MLAGFKALIAIQSLDVKRKERWLILKADSWKGRRAFIFQGHEQRRLIVKFEGKNEYKLYNKTQTFFWNEDCVHSPNKVYLTINKRLRNSM